MKELLDLWNQPLTPLVAFLLLFALAAYWQIEMIKKEMKDFREKK